MAPTVSKMSCSTKWSQSLHFEAEVRGHHFHMDAKKEAGGTDQGPSPKEVLLASICACSGMDVVSILQKMRLDLRHCEVNAATETVPSHPAIFKEVHVEYQVTCPDAKPEQVLRAVTLSMTKYCGVSAMVAPTSPISYSVFLNQKNIGEGKADFTAAESTIEAHPETSGKN
ncbi:MAG TPA: OsmC family protein [Bdellovibrio sp.]|nr:OsmC family protein [Bdellovibrio sp.]